MKVYKKGYTEVTYRSGKVEYFPFVIFEKRWLFIPIRSKKYIIDDTWDTQQESYFLDYPTPLFTQAKFDDLTEAIHVLDNLIEKKHRQLQTDFENTISKSKVVYI